MRVMRTVVCLVVGLVTACSSTPSTSGARSATPSPTIASPASIPSPLANATPVPGGCGSTTLYKGGMPQWLVDGTQGLTGMTDLPYALAGPTPVAGFVFSYPLKAGAAGPDGPKILWVVSTPRNESALVIQAHPLGSQQPVVKVTRPADSGPGEIYPDGVPIPTAGCWDFNLQWATGHAELDLTYSA